MNENQEMYLVHIARESEASNEPVPLRLLADHLDILPASVNQMIKKLEADGKVDYQPYKGVSLTDEGERKALRIIRSRRLWEVFLTRHLKFDPGEANQFACDFEHVTPPAVTERLAAFLGHPRTTPTGKSIPGSADDATVHLGSPLNVATAGERVRVKAMHVDEPQRAFLTNAGIAPGKQLLVLAIKTDGACLLHPQDASLVQLDARLTRHIRVVAVTGEDHTSQA